MINDDNLYKLYSSVLNNEDITTKLLNNIGFNSKDIKDLVDNNTISRIKRGSYSFSGINDLFYYGKKLIADKNYELADKCFNRCHELDPEHLGIIFQLFIRYIQEEDYDNAFILFDKLSYSDNEYYNIDFNYYLFILNAITDVPEKYKEFSKYIKFDDIKIPDSDKRYKDISKQNRIRYLVSQRKYTYALKLLNDLSNEHNGSTVQDLITKKLLYQAIKSEQKNREHILSLIQEKKYNELNEYLDNRKDKNILNIIDEYVLILTKKYIDIKNTSKIPDITISRGDTIFDNIDSNNFDEALKLNNSFNEKNNIKSSLLNLLLVDICNLISNIKNINNDNQIIDTNTNNLDIDNSSNNLDNSSIDFSTIVSCLINEDFDNLFIYLNKYLNNIGKSEYEFLIYDLIRISIYENDSLFSKVISTLSLLSYGNYSFDVYPFIQDFYNCLSKNEFDEARIYLDIISKANTFDQKIDITDVLNNILIYTEKYYNDKDLIKIDSVKVPVIKENNDYVTNQLNNKDNNINVSNNEIKSTNNKKNISDKVKKFLDQKHDLLVKNGGIILLKSMDESQSKELLDSIKDYPDISTFNIIDGGKMRIVLKYSPEITERIDISETIKIATQHYRSNNYSECINTYLKLLPYFKEPRSITYSKLGFAYMKNFNISTAIDYLTIANYLSKVENRDLDYSDLIIRLKSNIPYDERKKKVYMSENEFNDNIFKNYYGIDNFDEIYSYILDSGLDVESACIKFGLNEEQINLIKLICAREYYIQEDYDKGDLFLKSVEKSKDKTKQVKILYYELIKNKKFYKNRRLDNDKQLSLSLIPNMKK